jgi:hypothetical protein
MILAKKAYYLKALPSMIQNILVIKSDADFGRKPRLKQEHTPFFINLVISFIFPRSALKQPAIFRCFCMVDVPWYCTLVFDFGLTV